MAEHRDATGVELHAVCRINAGTPNGTVNGLKNQLCRDTVSGKIYRNTDGTPGSQTSNWELLLDPDTTTVLHNFTALSDPTVNEDSGDGYSVGSVWINTSTGAAFVCLDASTGAADWGRYGEVLHNWTASSAPTVNDDSGDGYSVGSIWVNGGANKAYLCMDASSGAARWRRLNNVKTNGTTSNPGASDNENSGYELYSIWINTTLDIAWMCLDPTVGSTIWTPITNKLNQMEATSAPGAGDDTNDGYEIGSFWYNRQTHILYVCEDPSSGAAVWAEVGRKDNYTATSAPTVNEDSGDGYSVGSIWLDTTTRKVYICVDASVGAAVWRRLNNVKTNETTSNPGAGNDETNYFEKYSIWINSTTGTTWMCTDPSTGAAVWVPISGHLNTMDATRAPGAGDDTNDGYDAGSMWYDQSTDTLYVCEDASSGAAVWQAIGGSGSSIYGTGTEVTISSGTATLSGSGTYTIDTEADAAEDILTTISGLSNGDAAFLRLENSARHVILRHWDDLRNVGNLEFAGGGDIHLTNANHTVVVYQTSGNVIVSGFPDNKRHILPGGMLLDTAGRGEPYRSINQDFSTMPQIVYHHGGKEMVWVVWTGNSSEDYNDWIFGINLRTGEITNDVPVGVTDTGSIDAHQRASIITNKDGYIFAAVEGGGHNTAIDIAKSKDAEDISAGFTEVASLGSNEAYPSLARMNSANNDELVCMVRDQYDEVHVFKSNDSGVGESWDSALAVCTLSDANDWAYNLFAKNESGADWHYLFVDRLDHDTSNMTSPEAYALKTQDFTTFYNMSGGFSKNVNTSGAITYSELNTNCRVFNTGGTLDYRREIENACVTQDSSGNDHVFALEREGDFSTLEPNFTEYYLRYFDLSSNAGSRVAIKDQSGNWVIPQNASADDTTYSHSGIFSLWAPNENEVFAFCVIPEDRGDMTSNRQLQIWKTEAPTTANSWFKVRDITFENNHDHFRCAIPVNIANAQQIAIASCASVNATYSDIFLDLIGKAELMSIPNRDYLSNGLLVPAVTSDPASAQVGTLIYRSDLD